MSIENGSALPLQATGIVKAFGHVQALAGVDLEVGPHEVVALVGDNGAGKSTLIKCISGVYRPDAGEISVGGVARTFKTPADAAAAGLATVYQDLALVDTRDVASNIFLGREFTRGPFIDYRRGRREAETVIRRLSATIPSVRSNVGMLSGGQRQAVAIARALVQGAHLVILDEPTAALGVVEAERVLRLIEELREQGSSVLLVSHNLEHVLRVADRITVIQRGRSVGTLARADATVERIVHLIVAGTVAHQMSAMSPEAPQKEL
jgi:ABC-type sugar transport system ATPase subunit